MAARPPPSTGSIKRTARGRRPNLSSTAPSLISERIYDVYPLPIVLRVAFVTDRNFAVHLRDLVICECSQKSAPPFSSSDPIDSKMVTFAKQLWRVPCLKVVVRCRARLKTSPVHNRGREPLLNYTEKSADKDLCEYENRNTGSKCW